MNNGCSSVLVERLRDVNAGMAGDDDDDVKRPGLSAQQNRKAGRGRTVLSVFWDRNSQRKLTFVNVVNFEALCAYLTIYFF